MQKVEWTPFLSMGNARIDDDHQRLIGILNRLADREARRERAFVAAAVEEMVRYTGEHFAREEELMAAVRYPLLGEHRQRHRELTAKILAWRTRVAERWHPWHGGTFFAVLAHWLVTHILEDDRMIADFCRTGTIVHRFTKEKGAARATGPALLLPVSGRRVQPPAAEARPPC